MKKTGLFLLLVLPVVYGYAQEQLKFSGYVQTQWTWNRAEVANGHQNDFSVRRGRLKANYANEYGEAVFQIDVTEEGVNIKDAYLKVKMPTVDWVAVRAGVFDRPFGYEISYSSSVRESPERSRVFQLLFPKERDLGAEVILKGRADTKWQPLTLNIGLVAGNGGQAKETDSRKDVVGHLAYTGKWDVFTYAVGTSIYSGGVRLAGGEGQRLFSLHDGKYVNNTTYQPGDYAKRQYFGVDGQASVTTSLGATSLHAEYLWGKQPGAIGGSKSPTGAIVSDIYLRSFNGCYVQLVQDIGTSKHAIVAKYDVYDPNTKLSNSECQTEGDVAYHTLGLGWLFRANQNLCLTCYYEMNINEKVTNELVDAKYSKNLKDDVFTLRLQYRF